MSKLLQQNYDNTNKGIKGAPNITAARNSSIITLYCSCFLIHCIYMQPLTQILTKQTHKALKQLQHRKYKPLLGYPYPSSYQRSLPLPPIHLIFYLGHFQLELHRITPNFSSQALTSLNVPYHNGTYNK